MEVLGQTGGPLIYLEDPVNGSGKLQRGTVRALPVAQAQPQPPQTFVAVQPAQAQINISGTGWLLIGLVLFLVFKNK